MKIIILALSLTLLSTNAFSAIKDLNLDKDLGGGCTMKQFVSHQELVERYCSVVVTTCVIDKDKTRSLWDSNCDVNQELAKSTYKSIQTLWIYNIY